MEKHPWVSKPNQSRVFWLGEVCWGVLEGKTGIISAASALRSFAHWREQTANDSIDGSEMGLHLNEGWGSVVRTCLSKRKYIK